MGRWLIPALAVLAVAGLVLLLTMRGGNDAKSTESTTPASTRGSAPAATTGSAGSAARTRPVDKVGRVSKEERAKLAEQIARAKAKRAENVPAPAGGGTTPAPALPESDATLVRTTMKDAMKEIIPFLAECYDKGGSALPRSIKVVAQMTLTGDPDVGTIIDTNGVADGDGQPLEPAFDVCLRDALVTLQMPPLSEGGEVKVTYPFLFAQSEEDAGSGSGP